MKKPLGPLLRLALLGGILVLILIITSHRSKVDRLAKPIPGWILARPFSRSEELIRYLPVEVSGPVPHRPVPQHPFMASNPGSNMHNDASMSDTYEASGPLGIHPKIHSRSQGFGGYGTVNFDRAGRLVAVYSNSQKFQLELMDPVTLVELASYDLPSRPWNYLFQGVMPWEYIGAGTYFYLDEQDRAVLPTTKNTVQVVQVPSPDSAGDFQLLREYDLSDMMIKSSSSKEDSVAWVLPDWEGKFYWFATTQGTVGTIDIDTGAISAMQLKGEVIENSFAVGPDGVFILSDHALYNLGLSRDGNIEITWRTSYERGPAKKPGVITRGSGTSVTLLGGEEGMVAITDNDEPRINLLFINRFDGSLACSQPLFEENRSATDITLIGIELSGPWCEKSVIYSAIVENNWGPSKFPFARSEPGITRVDLEIQEDGSTQCREVWTSEETNIGVFKLSLGNGLLYTYYRNASPVFSDWYFTAIDFNSGETVFKQRTGSGIGYNNWAGAIFLHPEKSIAYSTTLFGLVMMQDASP